MPSSPRSEGVRLDDFECHYDHLFLGCHGVALESSLYVDTFEKKKKILSLFLITTYL